MTSQDDLCGLCSRKVGAPLKLRPLSTLPQALIGGAVILLLGCSPNPESYYPIQEGHDWEYIIRMTSSLNNNPINQSVSVSTLPKRLLLGEEVVPFKRISHGLKGDSVTFRFVKQEAIGCCTTAKQKPDDLEPQAKYRDYHITYPVRVGKKWETEDAIAYVSCDNQDHKVTFHYTVESTTDQITVPAGNFSDCLKIRGEFSTTCDLLPRNRAI